MNRAGIIRGCGAYNVPVAGPGPLAFAPEVDAYRQQFEYLADQADALVAPLSEEQFTWRPAPGSWSIAGGLLILVATLAKSAWDATSPPAHPP